MYFCADPKIIESWKCWMWYLTKDIESTKNGISYHSCQCKHLLGKIFVIFIWWGRNRNIELEPEEIFERKQLFFLLSLYAVHVDASIEFYHDDLDIKQFIILFNYVIQIEEETCCARDSL